MTHSKPTSNSTPLGAYDQSEHTTCDNCGRTDRLTTLYAFPGDTPVQIRYFKIPAQYDRLCSNCFETANEHTLSDLTDDELIAGIISDSFGYATPEHAARHITDYKDGKEHCHCERGHAHFDNDLDKLMEAARRRWMSRSPKEKEALLETVAEWRDIETEDPVAALGVSMAYPSRNPEVTDHQQSSETDADTDSLFLSIPSEALRDTLFLRTDSYRFFTIDTLDDTPDEMQIDYLDNPYPSHISVKKLKTIFQNRVQHIDTSEIDTHPPAYTGTFLTPTDTDIDALRATLRRSNHPPTEYLDYFLSLKLTAGHIN